LVPGKEGARAFVACFACDSCSWHFTKRCLDGIEQAGHHILRLVCDPVRRERGLRGLSSRGTSTGSHFRKWMDLMSLSCCTRV